MESAGKVRAKPVKQEVFREYCESSSIHGVRYFDQHERTPCERFWWIIVFLLSLAGCATMIFKAYTKWEQAPIIVSFSEKATPVWDLPFPAVTICPEAKLSAEKLNFSAEMHAIHPDNLDPNKTIDAETIGKLKAVAQVCYGMFQSGNYHLRSMNGTNDNDVVNVLKNVSVNTRHMIGLCSFDDELYTCYRYMKETVTEHGLCYSFNMLPEHEMFRKGALHNDHAYMEDLYADEPEQGDEEHVRYPLYANDAGLQAGLKLLLITETENIDFTCTGIDQGYKLLVHEPGEYPQVSRRHIRIPLGHEISIAVKPQMITTSKSAADYHWSKRHCFFDNERHLRFFQIYNLENCELECLTNITMGVCGCVRFSMPRSPDMKVCSLADWQCMTYARSFFKESHNTSELSSQYNDAEGGSIAEECNCLPACSSIQYDLEVTQSALDLQKFIKANRIEHDRSDSITICLVTVYFKEAHVITSRRSELYGMVDFLANCGGLLGLFMGVSILSLLEICYYISIRPFSLRKARKRSGGRDARKTFNDDNGTLLAVITKND